ncbi:DUF3667 domain-containing protein [Tahibacter caeni]|uniref:DUF3667 domain-containing protein n=1 Tax=Tahibacter caeni TaxID=1453545 RepID=UPI002148416E|nr:DUF3667 domain-containing protein [Tahibacter caeni]
MNSAPYEQPLPDAPPAAKTAAAKRDAPAHCANCNAPLHGEYCHDCGQPIKGMIRPLSGLTADVFDSVFNIDSRILRTIVPLYFRPGYLTNEYFIGRRVRYVTPFRLFFFLTIVAFFVAQLFSDQMGFSAAISNGIKAGDEALASLQTAATQQDAASIRDKQLAGLDAALKNPVLPPEARREIEAAREEIRKRAQERIEFLKNAQEAKAKGLPPPVPALPPEAGDVKLPPTPEPPIVIEPDDEGLSFNGKPWDAKHNPLKTSWLPDAGNAKLNELIGTAVDNARHLSREPKRFVAAFFGVLPQTLFVLMPLFAVMLKFFYLFKRRYYTEHLIVALHSHAFISMSVLLICLLGLANLAFPAATLPLTFLMKAAVCWIPVYLLLMQKRVYRQGWIMTVLKYGVIGTCYSVLIGFALAIATLVTLVVA